MTEKNRNTRAGSPGGDRPLRRPAKKTPTAHPAREDSRPAKPRFDKPRLEKPRFDKPRFDKPAARDAESARDKRPGKPLAKPFVKPPSKQRVAAPAPAPREGAFEGDRIAKVMARAGVCSRRDAERWITEGRVAVNGRVQTSPAFNVSDSDKITVDGAPMQARERTRLFLFHKPAGYVTTARDEEGRATVFSYLEERHPDLPRLVSVGRLDINTEGLLLLTNDGGLARTLELPATGWTRRYRVRAHGAIDQAQLDSLGDGVTIDGIHYAPIEARLEREQGANVWIAMNLTEGKNREIKRVMAHLGLDVTRLIRVSYGPFQLGDLTEGAVEEVRLKMLREQLGKSLAELAGVDFAAPLREKEPAEQQEIRVRAEKRPRKHVSTLRKEQDERRDAGPRARVTRGAVADRKGRAVAVERVTPTRTPTRRRDETAAPPSRNARRFEAMRADGAPHQPKARTERPSRDSKPRGERFPREDGRRRDERAAPEQRRAPRFDDDQRGARPPTRAPRERGAEGRDERPRNTQRFEKRPDDRASGQRNYRTASRDDARFEKRPPRRDGDEARRDTRGASATRQERPRTFDKRPARSGERDFSAGERAPRERKFDQPRSGGDARPSRSGGPSRGPHKGPRSGPGKGPAGGRGAPRKGPPKGPFKGPRKGPPKGPRKPRGA
ncbi:pseudouridine synthase [Methylocystis rosea]|uniref:Pseudouridine synthase n=1 Tax=Methylocystis rosea TaxID=173366 RepID=A0ABX6EIL5_9HYPH|nr:pseudouridine synthase [Methylocystis rosea]QGM94277.1 pseudouridine synthase [Methylocystis rosea]